MTKWFRSPLICLILCGLISVALLPGQEKSNLAPEKVVNIYDKGNEYFKEKKYEAAIAEFEQIIASYPNSSAYEPALYLDCVSYFRLNDYDKTVQYGEKFVKEFPGSEYSVKVYALLGQAYYKLANDSQSALYLIKFYIQTDDSTSRKNAFATALEILPRLAVPELEKLHRAYLSEPVDEHVLYALAQAEMRDGKKKEAQRDFELLVRRFPNTQYTSDLDEYMRVLNLGETSGRIGVLLPLSGKFADNGEKLYELIKNFEKVEKLPFAVLTEDTKSDAIEAILAADKLIANKVDFIIGPLFSFEAFGVCALAYAKGVPVILPALESRFEAIPLVYTTTQSSENQARVIARYAMDQLEINSFAVIYPDIAKFKELAEVFSAEVLKNNRQVVAMVSFNPDSITLKWELERIKKQKPEAIFLAMDTDMIINTAPQVPYYGLDNVKLLGIEYFRNEKVPRLGEKTVEGAYFAASAPIDSEAVTEYKQFSAGDIDFFSLRFFQILWKLKDLRGYNRSSLPSMLSNIFQGKETYYIYQIHDGDFKKLTEITKE
jgi:ABC-type branched-subunit amino acid transport system substrate-binding protein/outer membrane protein assembly factor BamD (BamD/ComL family)